MGYSNDFDWSFENLKNPLKTTWANQREGKPLHVEEGILKHGSLPIYFVCDICLLYVYKQ